MTRRRRRTVVIALTTVIAVVAMLLGSSVALSYYGGACEPDHPPAATTSLPPAVGALPTSLPLNEAQQQRLLAAYTPGLVDAEREEFSVEPVEALIEQRDAALYRTGHSDEVIASATGAPKLLSLELIGTLRHDAGEYTIGVRADDYAGWKARSAGLDRYPPVIYGRLVVGADGDIHLRYGMFSVFNHGLPRRWRDGRGREFGRSGLIRCSTAPAAATPACPIRGAVGTRSMADPAGLRS